MVPQHGAEPGAAWGAGGREGRPGRGSGGRGGDRRAANRRAAHQLTAFAYTRCTPAAGSTKPGRPRAPAASRGARRGPRARACSALRARRGAGGVSPGGGIPRRPKRLPRDLAARCPSPCTPLLLPSCPALPASARPPRAGLSPGPPSSCCSCVAALPPVLVLCRGPPKSQ